MSEQIVVDVAKGIERDTLYTMTQVIRDEISSPIKLVTQSNLFQVQWRIGDLIITITFVCRRNNRCGVYVGQGIIMKNAVNKVRMVVERINAIPAAIQLG